MKKLAIALAVLAALAAGALWWTYESLVVIVKFALEYYGPKVAGST